MAGKSQAQKIADARALAELLVELHGVDERIEGVSYRATTRLERAAGYPSRGIVVTIRPEAAASVPESGTPARRALAARLSAVAGGLAVRLVADSVRSDPKWIPSEDVRVIWD